VPRRKSINLTEGELRLMNVLWKKGPGTVGEVTASLANDPPLAYSTVLTTLRILESKGYLRHSKRGRAFVYEPVIAQEEASRSALGYLVSRFFAGSHELLVVNLLKQETISRAELRRIQKMIAESEGEQK
jgi:BlaI family transcriptional regulator, penicillinase repressor